LILSTAQWYRNGSNAWVWGLDDRLGYTVRSGYALLEREGNNTIKEAFKILWSLKVAPTTQVLVWRVLWNRLPTRGNLVVREVQLANTLCPLCNMFEKTVDHLFINCDIARKIWDLCDQWIGNFWVRHHSVPDHFLSFYLICLNKKLNVLWLRVWVAIVWEIWTQRNKVVFNGGVVYAIEVFSLAQLKGWLWAKYKN